MRTRTRTLTDRASTAWDVLLALGLLCSLATQLRAQDAPVGPGELLLAIWLAPVAALIAWRFRRVVSEPFWRLLQFWSVFALALCLGAIFTISHAILHDWGLAAHDVIAYGLLIALTSCLTIAPDCAERLARLQKSVVLVGSAMIALQDLNALEAISFETIDPWYWDRMRGWCSNPNQFALLCLAVGLMSFSAAERPGAPGWRAFALVCGVVDLASGMAAKSNAYLIVVLASLGMIVMLKSARALTRGWLAGNWLPGGVVALMAASVVVALTALPALVTPDGGGPRASIARDEDKEGDEVGLRVSLWRQAIDLGGDSWLLGLGPGPHLEIPIAVLAGRRTSNEPLNIQHPTLGQAPNFEAHNTVLELLVQGGALAAASFVWLFGTSAWRAWRGRMDGLVVLLVAVLAFGSFHVVFRHPIVWFSIVLALTTPRTGGRSGAIGSIASGVARRTA